MYWGIVRVGILLSVRKSFKTIKQYKKYIFLNDWGIFLKSHSAQNDVFWRCFSLSYNAPKNVNWHVKWKKINVGRWHRSRSHPCQPRGAWKKFMWKALHYNSVMFWAFYCALSYGWFNTPLTLSIVHENVKKTTHPYRWELV